MSNQFNLKDVQLAYFGLLTEAKIDDMLEKSDLSPEQKEMVRSINNQLPNKSKYVEFIIKRIMPNINNLKTDDIVRNLTYFDTHPHHFQGFDINQTVYDGLASVIRSRIEYDKFQALSSKVDKLFENDKFLVLLPRTYEACKKYGAGTKWCITMEHDRSFWDNYINLEGDRIYYIIRKGVDKEDLQYKVAVQVHNDGSRQYWDAQDRRITEQELKFDISDLIKYFIPDPLGKAKQTASRDLFEYNEDTGRYDRNQRGTILIDEKMFDDKTGTLAIPLGVINGSFVVENIGSLKNLKNFPYEVKGDFSILFCKNLETLQSEHNPENIKISGNYGVFTCSNLRSLKGMPTTINKTFELTKCRNIDENSLADGPKDVKGDVVLIGCKITSEESVKKYCRVGGEIEIIFD